MSHTAQPEDEICVSGPGEFSSQHKCVSPQSILEVVRLVDVLVFGSGVVVDLTALPHY